MAAAPKGGKRASKPSNTVTSSTPSKVPGPVKKNTAPKKVSSSSKSANVNTAVAKKAASRKAKAASKPNKNATPTAEFGSEEPEISANLDGPGSDVDMEDSTERPGEQPHSNSLSETQPLDTLQGPSQGQQSIPLALPSVVSKIEVRVPKISNPVAPMSTPGEGLPTPETDSEMQGETAQNLNTPKDEDTSKHAKAGRKRKSPSSKPKLDPNALPHGLGVKAGTESGSGAEETSGEGVSKSTVQRYANTTLKKPEQSKRKQVKEVVNDVSGVSDTESINGSPEIADTQPTVAPNPQKVKKPSQYGVQLGVTPYPDMEHPTADECREVERLLSGAHGKVEAPQNIPVPSRTVAGCGEVRFVLESILRTYISTHTSMSNADKAIQGLLKRFPTITSGPCAGSVDWNTVRLADVKYLELAIRSGGMAPTKSRTIKAILDMVYDENQAKRKELADNAMATATEEQPKVEISENPTDGETRAVIMANLANEILSSNEDILTLDYIHAMSAPEAFDKLLQYPGIGVKTAACVLLFCMQHPSFAVDTHVFRLAKWLGWVPPDATRDTTFAHCDVRVPDELKYPLHQLLIVHGKSCGRCKAFGGEGGDAWKAKCVLENLLKRDKKPSKASAKSPAKRKKKGSQPETDREEGEEGEEVTEDEAVSDEPPTKKAKAAPSKATPKTKPAPKKAANAKINANTEEEEPEGSSRPSKKATPQGAKGKAGPKRKAKEMEEDDDAPQENGTEKSKTPRKQTAKKNAARTPAIQDEDADDENSMLPEKPVPKAGTKRRAKAKAVGTTSVANSDEDESSRKKPAARNPPAKRAKKANEHTEEQVDDAADDDEDDPPSKKPAPNKAPVKRSKKGKKEAEDKAEDDEEEGEKPKAEKKTPAKRARKTKQSEEEVEQEKPKTEKKTPAKRASRAKKAEESKPAPKAAKGRGGKASAMIPSEEPGLDSADFDAEVNMIDSLANGNDDAINQSVNSKDAPGSPLQEEAPASRPKTPEQPATEPEHTQELRETPSHANMGGDQPSPQHQTSIADKLVDAPATPVNETKTEVTSTEKEKGGNASNESEYEPADEAEEV